MKTKTKVPYDLGRNIYYYNKSWKINKFSKFN